MFLDTHKYYLKWLLLVTVIFLAITSAHLTFALTTSSGVDGQSPAQNAQQLKSDTQTQPQTQPQPVAQNQPTGIPTAGEMIQNIAKQIPSLLGLAGGIAYVMGMLFIIMGIMRLKHVGEMRTMMSHEHSLKGPILYLAVGAALIYLPTTLQVGLSTFWTSPNPYGYVTQKDEWTQTVGTCLMIVQLFGVIAFIRGLVMLAHLGGQGGGHQGGVGKAMTHIIGGIFCINIYQFVQVVMVTLGIQSPF